MIPFFLRAMSFVQEPGGMNMNDSYNFANYLKTLFQI